MLDPAAVLVVISNGLAVTLSELIKSVGSSKEDVENIVKPLAERNWIKVKELGNGEEVIYRITEDGVRELERTTRRGVAALL